ncbi:hypothetical protein [Pseudoxanthomonas sp. SGT-18]|uniref:hypothetical protein n=1 Tax=Pseudoxanthomonas sp. SGT-18 TaxID=2493087 RepID=UPI00198022FF|nr:hypothetical protein [Pseudoxanthomonas sp. SGT-18]
MPRGTAGSVRVGNGAVFQGAGRIGGDFTASPQATTAIAIGEPLQVQGQANLAGTLHLLAPAPGYPVGSSERLMGYRSHTGAFSAVTYGSGFFYTAQLDYGSNSLDARLERTSAASTASARARRRQWWTVCAWPTACSTTPPACSRVAATTP